MEKPEHIPEDIWDKAWEIAVGTANAYDGNAEAVADAIIAERKRCADICRGKAGTDGYDASTGRYLAEDILAGLPATHHAETKFTDEEKRKLRPIAETLAMIDGNAFFGNFVDDGVEWYEQYLSEARDLYESNGGDNGWAGEASFAKTTHHEIRDLGEFVAERKGKE